MFTSICFLPLLVFAAAASVLPSQDVSVQSPFTMGPVADNNTRVQIVLGVMSRCSDAFVCESVMDGAFQATWDIIDVDLSFVGTLNKSDENYGVSCKHGPQECAGNIQELCAMNRSQSQEDWWNFVQCINFEGRDAVGDVSLAQRCVGISSIPWEDEEVNGVMKKGVKSCVEGQEGKELLKNSVAKSKENGIEKSCTVMISGVQRCVRDKIWRDCETGHTEEEIIAYIKDEHQRLLQNDTSGP